MGPYPSRYTFPSCHKALHSMLFWTTLLLFLGSCMAFAIESSSMTTSHPPETIVVAGATGKVGSRLVRQLCDGKYDDLHVVALVRNSEKARSMFGTHLPSSPSSSSSSLTILEADYSDVNRLKAAFDSLEQSSGPPRRLFLACGNVPEQAKLELNVARAAKEMGIDFCVKLSTAMPIMEAKEPLSNGKDHRIVEEELSNGEIKIPHCVLRPNAFMQLLSSDTFLGVKLRNSDEAEHYLADSEISMIDCEDVAACAAAILTSSDIAQRDGQIYELTGPEAIRISNQFAAPVSNLRPRRVQVKGVSLEKSLGDGAVHASTIKPFLDILASYSKVTSDVEKLTGRPARSIANFVMDDPAPFLPKTFQRLVAKGKAPSFRDAAHVVEASLDEEVAALDDDEVLIRVQAAGVNGGHDTFDCTRASPDAKDFPLGHEGTGVVVMCGKSVSRVKTGSTAVFVVNGAYSEYVVAKERTCVTLPPDAQASPSELTALRISGLTALVALEATEPVQKGDVVLVTACCGGTGHFAVQIAKRLGATVIGTVGSTAKVATAKELGADRVVDLSRENLGDVLRSEYPGGVDIAYEGVGGPLLRDICDNLADGGRVLVVGSISQYPHNSEASIEKASVQGLGEDIMDIFRAGKTIELDRGRKIVGNVWGGLMGSDKMLHYRDRVYELFFKGELKPIVHHMRVSELQEVCDAVDYMLSRKSIGKVCVVMGGE